MTAMMTTAAVDVHSTVTVKQHGFHVRQPFQPGLGEAAPTVGGCGAQLSLELGALPSPASPYRREEGGGARGMLRIATPCTSTAQPALHSSGCLQAAEHAHLTPGVKRLMKGVVRGIKALQEPEAASEGLGGTYFFTNEAGQKIGIMKPCDEEPLAPNNPKGFVGRQLGEPGLKPTVRVGEAASREVAAYLLDHDRFARVPHTVMVRMTHPIFHVQGQHHSPQQQHAAAAAAAPATSAFAAAAATGQDAAAGADCCGVPCKLGSLQQFVSHDCDTSEMGASRFSVRDVQRIGILDLRLFNTDRHAGNMLVRRRAPSSQQRMDGASLLDMQQYELVPIDHGFALPEALEPPYFEWQHWPQAMLPFGREELEYIAGLDAKADIEMLRKEVPSLRVESLRVLEVCTTLLQECAAAGLTLAEIAGVATRPLIGMEEEPSELERICFNARAEVEDISDSDIEEAVDEAGLLLDSDDDGNAVAMLSVEEVDEEAMMDGAVVSPTSSSEASDGTAFKMSLAGSGSLEGNRLEDVLFSMDEDSGGHRTPPRARSPDALASRLPPSRFAAEAGKAVPSALMPPPITPKAAGLAVSFVSPLSTGAEDSLPASFDSLTLHQGGNVAMGRDASMGGPGPSAFRGAASFAPAGYGGASSAGATGPSTGGGSGPRRGSARKTRSRRKLAIGSRLLKLTSQHYPPLVESRAGGSLPAMSALAVFRDLSEEQWEAFMACVRFQVARKLRDGAWKQNSPSKGAPLMSCPRF
ncbi:hypothetical protein D9Q98_008633 [Chlorella vulgaris]|uniref:1-phosphatidylinositol 4-kinase n=1 Tax=Chlorella vulgaris TaxID=3077 RepID=A0A9D4TIB6_CHLVU|nr:hypothetical protein D9Q98_008633 [Chlorella vulgaris]